MIFNQTVNIDVDVSGNKWLPVTADVQRSRYSKADSVKGIFVPDPEENPNAAPVVGDDIYVETGPKQSVSDDGGREANLVDSVRVFTGYVSNVYDFGDGSYQIEAANYSLDLEKSKISISTGDQVKVTEFVRQVVKDFELVAGINMETNIDTSENVNKPYGFSRFETFGPGEETGGLIQREFTDTKVSEILDRLSEAANAIWWIDRFNRLNFGPTDTAIHKLAWVVDTSAGKQTPPYRSVRVIGDGVASAEGWEASGMLSEDTAVQQRNVKPAPGFETPTADTYQTTTRNVYGLRPPTFVYRNDAIKTQREADEVSNRLIDELQQQQAGGHVEVVGRPMIDILDAIEMPDSFARTAESPLGSSTEIPPAQYSVQTVKHRYDASEGFTTRVECGGLGGRYSGPVYELNDDGKVVLSTQESNEEDEDQSDEEQEAQTDEIAQDAITSEGSRWSESTNSSSGE